MLPKILTVVGARPQFIKAAPVSRALSSIVDEYLVNTGQHYDASMSSNFFDELDISMPAIDLGIGSGFHGAQTGRMLEALEAAMLEQAPDVVQVYGDTNSTLAGALAAAKLAIPVAHVEAGLRSWERKDGSSLSRSVRDTGIVPPLASQGSAFSPVLRPRERKHGSSLLSRAVWEMSRSAATR